MSMPAIGATKMKITVAVTTPKRMDSQPKAARKAPAKPPISVCEDDDGMPYHQVTKFHVIADNKPAKIMGNGRISGLVNWSCTVFDMVLATL